ncbi:MAG: glycoside hydrolase family 15 protein [Anaerolineales bacterium]
MPRNLPLGNGNLLVAFDDNYQIRDLYWPHVGQDNHALGHPFRLGVWVNGHFSWIDDSRWEKSLLYQTETLVTNITLKRQDLSIEIKVSDAVDFHENLLVRRFEIKNLSEQEIEVRLFFHHDFHIAGYEVGDTAYYEPERRAVFHYKGPRWFLVNGAVSSDSLMPNLDITPTKDTFPGIVAGLHQWACGLKEIHHLEGTWKDAEDGILSGDSVAHGSVDSTVSLSVRIPGKAAGNAWYWMAIGENFDQVVTLNRMVRQRGPESFIKRAAAFWRLFLNSQLPDLSEVPESVADLYKRSLLVIRTQIDNGGAIIAANDTDISSAVRDTYSYMWPRDGALVANALNRAGYLDLPRAFFQFTQRALSSQGYLLHKYNPDGSLASSWHAWYRNGKKDLPIQEDETALVLWALWEHFDRFGDVYFIKPLYRSLICPMADFLVEFRDPATGLPYPSYDLWEERHGILGWTVGSVYGGLRAAANFAHAFGETDLYEKYMQAAADVKDGVDRHLWQADTNSFARMINHKSDGSWEVDKTIDASLVGLWQFGMYAPDDPKITATMQAIRERLWVKTEVGGIARYENDRYHQISQDIENVPGNPWFITTLWLAEWYAVTAQKPEDLQPSLELLEWVSNRALPSGVLAEQVNPYTNAPLSVSPLTWSHAVYVATVQTYLEAIARVQRSNT